MNHIKKLIIGFLILIFLVTACQNDKDTDFNPEFEKLCKDRTPDNWMNMRPMLNGKFTSDESCWVCMSDDGMSHYCTIEEYRKYLEK